MKSSLFAIKYWFYDLVKVTAAVPCLIFFRPKVIYENEAARKKIRGGALLVSNHTCFWDPLYLMLGLWYRRHHYICAQLFFDGKLKWLFKHFLCIPIDRDNVSFSSVNNVIAHLKAGEVVCIFPEGHINWDEGTEKFKSGAVIMAHRSGAPVVNAYVKKRKHWWSRAVIALGEPIDITRVLGKRPNLSAIEQVSAMIYEKEMSLAMMTGEKN